MIPRKYSAFIVLLAASACGRGDGRHYETLEEVRRTNDHSIVAGLAVPQDARSIHVRLDVETGLFYISYITSEPGYAIREKEMAPIEENARGLSSARLGFGGSVPADARIHVRCHDKVGAGAAGGRVAKELLFLADARGTQYQWNNVHDATLIGDFCS